MEQVINKKVGNKISVITVVYNDVKKIRSTIESFLSQTWKDKEYIVIDGGSSDGTAEIIQEYSDKLSYWCSEKDNGIYDAMNKGISKVTGDWICILNSGDYFASPDSLEKAITLADTDNLDVIYGNSIELDLKSKRHVIANEDTNALEFSPIYRHGSSLIRTEVQRKFLYNTSLSNKLKYSLDWKMIYTVYKQGYRFGKVDVDIEIYDRNGMSNHQFMNLYYNYKITSCGKFSLKKFLFFMKQILWITLKNSILYIWIKAIVLEVIVNDILPLIPFWCLRRIYLKIIGTKIEKGSIIMKNNYFINPNLLTIGKYCHINRNCILDSRGGIVIGDNVSISHKVNIMTGSHDVNDKGFCGIFKSIKIKDYAWLGVNSTILQGVTIGKGAVVCAGAVVTKDVEDYTIVAGIPAKKIRDRRRDLDYKCEWNVPFT